MLRKNLTIINRLGLHARAAALLARTAARFGSKIRIGVNERMVDAKSVMSLMLLAASQGCHINVEVDGDDEQDAMEAIETLINDRFNEPE